MLWFIITIYSTRDKIVLSSHTYCMLQLSGGQLVFTGQQFLIQMLSYFHALQLTLFKSMSHSLMLLWPSLRLLILRGKIYWCINWIARHKKIHAVFKCFSGLLSHGTCYKGHHLSARSTPAISWYFRRRLEQWHLKHRELHVLQLKSKSQPPVVTIIIGYILAACTLYGMTTSY